MDDIHKLLHMTPAQWEELAGDKNEAARLAQQADALSINLVRFSRYVDARARGRSHRQAVKAQNTAAASVRRILGYSIHRDDKTF